MFSEHQGYTGPNSFISSNRLSNYDLTSNRTSSYPDEVPVTRRLTDPISSFEATYYHIADDKVKTEEIALPVSNLNLTASSLQNVAKKYLPHSPHFEFNSSVLNRNLLSSSINFVFIPRMYYGSAIKRGSVALNYYLTGALMASCTDERENGELIETHGFRSGSTVGIVLYDEGVIMLTASHMLEQVTTSSIEYTPGTAISSSWMYYGTTLNDGTGSSGTLSNVSYGLKFKGTEYVNSMTIMATAPVGEVNYSNNPTYKNKNLLVHPQHTASGPVYSDSIRGIKNIVSASHISASFQKTTYISKIRLYDDNNRLIGIAALSKPLKKKEERSYTFKLRIDLN